jgi:carbon monoxide dehydrogenase subunit G
MDSVYYPEKAAWREGEPGTARQPDSDRKDPVPITEFHRDLVVAADRTACWAVLTDVPRLVSWISIVGDANELAYLERYTAVLIDRMGPFKMRADLDISVDHVKENEHIHVRASGEDRGVGSRLAVDAVLSLEDSGLGTLISTSGTYEVVGKVATLGAGVIQKKATKIIDEFFENTADALGRA